MDKFLKLTEALIVAIIEKLGGEDAALSFLNSDLENKNWIEKDGIIYCSVLSTGRTADEWLDFFQTKGIDVSEWAEPVFHSKRFKPTNGVLTEVAIIKKQFRDKNMDYEEQEEIELRAEDLKFKAPNPEVICLIIEKFSTHELIEMELDWLHSMHKPILDEDEEHDGGETRLGVSFSVDTYYLDADRSAGGLCFNEGLYGGFIYAKSIVKTKLT